MKRSTNKGFTIVELVIVIAIIAILAAVLIPTFASLIQKANESNDIQAAKNMNTFLAMANVTDGVDSILDVYDLFESSGYSVESYKPLYAGRSYYYDKQANQIVYVDDATGKILYPTERKDQLQEGHDWLSLSMTVAKMEKPADNNYSESNNTITATVKSAGEYAYVVEKFNAAGDNATLMLTISENIDLKGANCVITNRKGTITIKGEDNKKVTLKNVTNNILLDNGEVHNDTGTKADYYSGGIIAKLESGAKVTFENITFENINVKTPTGGGVGLLVGQMLGNCSVTMKNVTVKNSTVIGHRDVGALVGAMQNGGTLTLNGNITLDNVKVKTTGGRSALVVGKMVGANSKLAFESGSDLVLLNNSSMSIYEDADLEQKFASGDTESYPSEWSNVKSTAKIAGQEKWIYSFKGFNGSSTKDYAAYGYKGDALVIVQDNGAYSAVSDLTALKQGITVSK